MALRPVVLLLRLQGFPILQQLQLEERLPGTPHNNSCLLNDGTIPQAIVMGISGQTKYMNFQGSAEQQFLVNLFAASVFWTPPLAMRRQRLHTISNELQSSLVGITIPTS